MTVTKSENETEPRIRKCTSETAHRKSKCIRNCASKTAAHQKLCIGRLRNCSSETGAHQKLELGNESRVKGVGVANAM